MFGQIIYNESDYALTLLDEKLELFEACEPSNIIWENLSNDPVDIGKKEARTVTIIIVYFTIIFFALVYGMQFVDKSSTKYPELTNCNNIKLGFEDEASYL